jgi:signal transduction histidine kinase
VNLDSNAVHDSEVTVLSFWKGLTQAVGWGGPAAHPEGSSLDRKSIEVLARVAHEARQPLVAARAAFALIRRSTSDGQRERACVILERQFVRLSRLFDDFLEASRAHLGKTTLRVEQLDLRGLVEEVSESVRPQVAEKHQRLATHLPDKAVWIEGDAMRLQQVNQTYPSTASSTRIQGDVCPLISHCALGDAVLTVSDTGRGISAEVLPHIFEPFTRGDGASEEGLGVGLAIARQLVELHGGEICASSAGNGVGSEFVVTLPARPSRYPYAPHGGQATTTLASTGNPRP